MLRTVTGSALLPTPTVRKLKPRNQPGRCGAPDVCPFGGDPTVIHEYSREINLGTGVWPARTLASVWML